jgi:arginyl-tRNA--protein-N-Asp/Glu arginylyltransferase
MTYQECLNALTEEQQKLFEKNLREDCEYNEEHYNLFKSYQFDNVYNFLAEAFVWEETAEKHKFWSDIAHNNKNQEK